MEKYEAVVVGAGPAGLAAAYELARGGVQTLVLERGKTAGRKSVTGGILYGQTNTPYNLDHLFPDFHKEAPVERPIRRYEMVALAGDKAKTLNLSRLHEHEMKWSYSVLRVPFDAWFAEKVHREARKSGGGVVTDVRVTGPLVKDGRIAGVTCDALEDIEADVVIAADGATSELVRAAGLRDWGEPDTWFQGVKAVVKVKDMASRFGLGGDDDGAALLYAGDVFGGVRGGGFLYTNKDTLSIGTVFHLDSLAEAKIEPHRLLDRLLTHPALANMLGEEYEELEYSGKLIPDGKKAGLKSPYKDRMLAIGDAAGQMQAQGPVIKGMNLGITAGILAAQAFLGAKKDGAVDEAGKRYAKALRASYVWKDLRPARYRYMGRLGEIGLFDRIATAALRSSAGRKMFVRNERRVQGMFSSPFWAGAMPDTNLGYTVMPTLVAEELGREVERTAKATPRTLDERIAALRYDTAIGMPHIQLVDNTPAVSGAAVHTCPVSSPSSSRGCYSLVSVNLPSGGKKQVVALDTQPCIECGTCAIMAATKWEHPPGGKGVDYRYG
ncbi:MAG TPA: FAD-dependent oxidoreductase [Candidatus Thermoplasmatota archaeon]|nr:FAD-dependent oxidoreductase [Candidatus Thermoplasmatota archaeon]